MNNYHIPVMCKEVLEYLDIKPGHWYLDCNLGGGGHTRKILEGGGKVLGIDLDPDAIAEVSISLKKFIDNKRLILKQTNFINIDSAITESTLAMKQFNNEAIQIKGVLFDLGVSTHQIEESKRGFSFNSDAPLDMRMDPSKGASAKDLVNGLYEKELAQLFLKLGEENWSKPIAKKIVEYRQTKQIETTSELANIILSIRRRALSDKIHPATRVFQALRIAVNDELNSLKEALPKAFDILQPGGAIVVISFQSLEDRIVKNYFKELEEKGLGKILTNKPIETSDEESANNPKARSAKLRAIEKP